MWGGASVLSRQQVSRRESVERRADICAIVKLPPTYERVGERLCRVTVVAFQLIDQTRGNSWHGSAFIIVY